jgi:hypothetical protein
MSNEELVRRVSWRFSPGHETAVKDRYFGLATAIYSDFLLYADSSFMAIYQTQN